MRPEDQRRKEKPTRNAYCIHQFDIGPRSRSRLGTVSKTLPCPPEPQFVIAVSGPDVKGL